LVSKFEDKAGEDVGLKPTLLTHALGPISSRFIDFCSEQEDDEDVEDDDRLSDDSQGDKMQIQREFVENLVHDDCVDSGSARMAGRGM